MKLFRLYIGTRHEEGAFSVAQLREAIVRTLQPHFPSFTLLGGEGWFRGIPEPGLTVVVATDDLPRLLDAASELRSLLRQDGIGLEFSSHYHRVTEGCDLDAVAREILGGESE